MTLPWTLALKTRLLVLDGATGTMLQARGLPAGAPPEVFCAEHPEVILQLQREYLDAGADLLMTPTFGANRLKLKHYGLEAQVSALNQKLARATVDLAHSRGKWAAGEMGPTGQFFQPFGDLAFEQGIELFAEQAQALEQAGVDVLFLATMIDIQEARIALLAAKEHTRLPVIVSLTFDEQGRTLTGSDPLTCLNILQSLGADGFGINCSTGPEPMVGIVRALAPYAEIPLFLKPNAGLPVVRDKQTVYPMSAEAFAPFAALFAELGAAGLGGCCGTTPEHIRQVAAALAAQCLRTPAVPGRGLLLSSSRRTVEASPSGPTPLRVVGERINPTGKPQFQAELKQGSLERLKEAARQQQAQGADLLDVNLGLPGVDERALMLSAIAALAVVTDLPLCIDSSSPAVIEAALRFYPGRALVNSLSGERDKLTALWPVLAKYGAAFILLPLDDRGIPGTAVERLAIAQSVLAAGEALGIPRQRAVVDGLALTIAAQPEHAQVTLDTIEEVSRAWGLNTIVGLSNISFGLPGREALNAAFLEMAASRGLSLVIANPGAPAVMAAKAAAEALLGRDPGSQRFLRHFSTAETAAAATARPALDPLSRLGQIILQGEQEQVVGLLKTLMDQKHDAYALVQTTMIPAIQAVGQKYDRREYFLPQLIASAQTMEAGVGFLQPWLAQRAAPRKGKGVLATVRGDVHDIGKNIVGLLLRNHGYEVRDLGKSVTEEEIVAQAASLDADFIGLSALMTTTMGEMEKVIRLVRGRGLKAKVVVGGAVVTRAFARSIGADGFAPDANQCVELLDQLLGKRT